ncbi:MAG: hypothetical protein RL215_1014 [Planctomycetota bacterium]|jgi:hypothetical protein
MMMAERDERSLEEPLLQPHADALSTAADRIHRQLQLRRLRLYAMSGRTTGAERLQRTALELRERGYDPGDPVRWLQLRSTGSPGLLGRMSDED